MTEPIIRTSYDDLTQSLKELTIPKHRVCIVGDSHTIPLYLDRIRAACQPVFTEVHSFMWQAGEEYKNLDSIRDLIGYLLKLGFDRRDCLLALGGGVVGDMTGFAAAVYLRGIPVIQVPTTLLSQIDSSIGGKTGVDFDGYKNMVGSFHLPVLVYTGISSLSTLPEDQLISGMGEVVKSALLGNADLFAWLRDHVQEIKDKDPAAIYQMVLDTAKIKTEIVKADPTEQGIRAYLNFGHTIGHAIEKYKNFSLQHGVCVGLGLVAASYMSMKRGLISKADLEEIETICRAFDLPTRVSCLDSDRILTITRSDKKMVNGRIRFILLKAIGQALIADDVSDQEILDGLTYIMEETA